MWNLLRSSYRKVLDSPRPLQICLLFGGKNDNNEQNNDAPSKQRKKERLCFVQLQQLLNNHNCIARKDSFLPSFHFLPQGS
ncbi:hypothetical protein P3S68_022426 [Capsicum galapagoense]